MLPAIAAGVVVAGALAQAYTANKQMGADQDRLNEIKDMFDAVKPPEIQDSLEDWAAKNKDILPQFNNIPTFEYLSPEQYKVIEKYNPQYAEYIKQVDPQTVKRSEVGEEGLSAQRQALRKLMMTGQLDQDPELMQRFAEADRNAQIAAQSRQQSLMQDFARRGQAGSGVQLAAQLGAGSETMDRAAEASQKAAAEAYRNRLSQLMQGAQLGGQMEQRDLSLAEKNADIINRFNEMTSKRYQDWLLGRADLANQAQKYNIEQVQDVANKNVNLANIQKEKQADISKWAYEQDKANKQQAFSNAMAGMQTENQAKQMQYQNALEKAKALSGVPSVNKWGYYSPIVQKATDFGTQWAASSYAQDAENKSQDREDRREYFKRYGQWPEDNQG